MVSRRPTPAPRERLSRLGRCRRSPTPPPVSEKSLLPTPLLEMCYGPTKHSTTSTVSGMALSRQTSRRPAQSCRRRPARSGARTVARTLRAEHEREGPVPTSGFEGHRRRAVGTEGAPAGSGRHLDMVRERAAGIASTSDIAIGCLVSRLLRNYLDGGDASTTHVHSAQETCDIVDPLPPIDDTQCQR